MLSTFIKLPFAIRFLFCLFLSGRFRQVLPYVFAFWLRPCLCHISFLIHQFEHMFWDIFIVLDKKSYYTAQKKIRVKQLFTN